MSVENPKIVQQIGIGTASNNEVASASDGAGATFTGTAGAFFGGTIRSG